jgi:hypothetical protein
MEMNMVGRVTSMGDLRNAYKILIEKYEEANQKYNIFIDLKEIVRQDADWIC